MRTSTNLLSIALVTDALVSGATGLLMLAGGGLLAGLLGLPAELLRWAGLALLPFAALVLRLARRAVPRRTAVLAVIAVNAAWAVASVALLLSGWVTPTLLGYVFVTGQAVVVAVFAELQVIGLRRLPQAAAAPVA